MDRELRLILRKGIEKYKKDNGLNTNTLRGHKIHDVGHDTIWKIMTNDKFEPSKKTIDKLLKGFGVTVNITYAKTSNNGK